MSGMVCLDLTRRNLNGGYNQRRHILDDNKSDAPFRAHRWTPSQKKRLREKVGDITKPTEKQLEDMVKAREKAGAKTEGKKKKGKTSSKRTRPCK